MGLVKRELEDLEAVRWYARHCALEERAVTLCHCKDEVIRTLDTAAEAATYARAFKGFKKEFKKSGIDVDRGDVGMAVEHTLRNAYFRQCPCDRRATEPD
jgi:hypothetical protein